MRAAPARRGPAGRRVGEEGARAGTLRAPLPPIQNARETIEAVFRMGSAKLVASLIRIVRDVGLAEDLAQDALVAALEPWPTSGVPENPGASLMATARNRAIDRVRRERALDRRLEEVGREQETPRTAEAPDAALDDDPLRLVLMTRRPPLPVESRVALTLRLVGGLPTVEIAGAFLAAKPTGAQRIARARRTLSTSRLPFEVPRDRKLEERLSAVLGVV